jgi:RNA exonuclease 1
MLEPITTTLQDIQKKLVGILNPHTILLGHSLNSDLTALKLTHPYIIDTALLFPHPRGPPLKQSLKFLSQKFLGREIQKGHGTTGPGAGHDSIEDARTCLDLVKQKCEKGREWGSGDVAGENIFKRVARTGIKYKNQGGSAIPSPMNGKKSAMVDWGEPRKGPGAAADFQIGCKSDEEVTDGIIRAVNGDTDGKEISGGGVDFVFGRLRELEALKGWWNNNRKEEKPGDTKPTDDTPSDVLKNTGLEDCTTVAAKESASNASSLPEFVTLDPSTSLEVATADLTTRLVKIYDALPYCTALIVYSGSGDPREMSRLQALQTQFKKEYKIKKWDQLSVKWTDVEEQALKAAVRQARNGVGFMAVK